MDSNTDGGERSAPETVPSPTQDFTGYNPKPSVHEFDTQVNFARRLILTLFPPILLVLFTEPMIFKSYLSRNTHKIHRWGDADLYWPIVVFVIGFYLWHLWAPHRLARMNARK